MSWITSGLPGAVPVRQPDGKYRLMGATDMVKLPNGLVLTAGEYQKQGIEEPAEPASGKDQVNSTRPLLHSYSFKELSLLCAVAQFPDNIDQKEHYIEHIRMTRSQGLADALSEQMLRFDNEECWFRQPVLHELDPLVADFWSTFAVFTGLRLKTTTMPCGRLTVVDKCAQLRFIQAFPSVAIMMDESHPQDRYDLYGTMFSSADTTPGYTLLQKFKLEINTKPYFVGKALSAKNDSGV